MNKTSDLFLHSVSVDILPMKDFIIRLCILCANTIGRVGKSEQNIGYSQTERSSVNSEFWFGLVEIKTQVRFFYAFFGTEYAYTVRSIFFLLPKFIYF